MYLRTSNKLSKSRPFTTPQIKEKKEREPAFLRLLQFYFLSRIKQHLKHHIKHNNERWRKLHTAYLFRLERGQEKSACRVSFILALYVKIAVISLLEKPILAVLHWNFQFLDILFPFKSNRPKNSNSSKIHFIGVDIILQKLPYSIKWRMFVLC